MAFLKAPPIENSEESVSKVQIVSPLFLGEGGGVQNCWLESGLRGRIEAIRRTA